MKWTAKENHDKAKSSRFPFWIKGYLYLTATALSLVGLFLLSTWWSTRNYDDWWLGWRDPLLGISSRAILVLGGALHLGAAAYLFATRNTLNRTLAVLWVGLNHLMYYVGVRMVEPSALPNAERFMGWRLQLRPEVVDARWRILQLCLITTSVVFIILIWCQSKQLRKEAWFRQWQETWAQQPIKKPVPPKKSQPAEEYAKHICAHCGQKIAFQRSRVGESVACPHCAETITLQEPPAKMV